MSRNGRYPDRSRPGALLDRIGRSLRAATSGLEGASDILYVVHRIDRRLARKFVPRFSGMVLSVGAGNQPFRELLPPGTRYIPTDLSVARRPELCCDICALPFASGSLDGVICTEVLEHVPEPWVAVREIARCLKDGGLLYVTVPMNWHLHYEPHDYYRFTRHGLQHLLQGAGLHVLCMERGGGGFSAALGKVVEVLWSSLALPVVARLPFGWSLARAGALLLFPVSWTTAIVARLLDRPFPRDAYIWAALATKRPADSRAVAGATASTRWPTGSEARLSSRAR